jgi:hypothetical protein
MSALLKLGERLPSASAAKTDGIFFTRVSGKFALVRVVGPSTMQSPDGVQMFSVVRYPQAKNCLNPRRWRDLYEAVPDSRSPRTP